MTALEQLVLSIGGGFALGLPFLRPSLWPLHYVALIPWIVLFAHPRYRARSWYILPGSFVAFFITLAPYGRFHVGLPVLMALCAFLPYLLFGAVVRRAVRLEAPLTIVVAAAWVVSEWLRTWSAFQQLQMYYLGSSQSHLTPLIQIADVTGVFGVSFVVAAINGALAELLIPGRRILQRLKGSVIVAAVVAATFAYGWYRIKGARLDQSLRVALIQPHETHYHDPLKNEAVFAKQLALTRAQIAPDAADLIAWPENAVDDRLNFRPDYISALARVAADLRADVLTGAFTGLSNNGYTASAYLITANSVDRYDKVHMIFWAEYMPLEEFLAPLPALRRFHYRLAETMMGQAGKSRPAEDVKILSTHTQKFAAPICFEITSAGWTRRAVGQGAHFLINITSEGVLGSPTYRQMWALSTFRAVENRISVLRAANNGLSGFIDSAGRPQRVVRGLRSGSPYYEPGVVIDRVTFDPRRGSTFYSNYGNVFVFACTIVLGLLLLRSVGVMRRRERVASEPATA